MNTPDTNVCIRILRGRNDRVAATYHAADPGALVLPSIVAGELMVGAMKSVRSDSIQRLEAFLSAHEIVPFAEDDFRIYAVVRARLERSGSKIGGNDTIIAPTALRSQATLVTHDTREFSRVPGLSPIDWEA